MLHFIFDALEQSEIKNCQYLYHLKPTMQLVRRDIVYVSTTT